MPSIELGPLGPQAARAVRAVDAKTVSDKPVHGRAVANDTARSHAAANSAVVRSDALDAGSAPVDTDRVAQIRKAIEQGHYPILPTRVADAMIAAGLLLRSGK
jgi:negative regulator of flagellin synthesis FlgM